MLKHDTICQLKFQIICLMSFKILNIIYSLYVNSIQIYLTHWLYSQAGSYLPVSSFISAQLATIWCQWTKQLQTGQTGLNLILRRDHMEPKFVWDWNVEMSWWKSYYIVDIKWTLIHAPSRQVFSVFFYYLYNYILLLFKSNAKEGHKK